MTLKNNRGPLLCYFKLCASFHSHWWIQTGVTVRKRPIWVKFDLKQNFACLQDKVRTTQPITTKLSNYVSLVMLIAGLDFGWILLEFFFVIFSLKISRSNTLLDISQEWLVRLMLNEKEVHWLDTGWTMWPWPLVSLMTLTFDFSRSNFKIAVPQDLLSDWCETKRKQIH